MSPANLSHISRQLALLKQLESKGLARGSDLLREMPASEALPERISQRGPTPLTEIFTNAERLGSLDGACLWRVRSEIPTDGSKSRQGYACPVSAWGGVPNPAVLALLLADPACLDCPLESIVFLDTETTGLSTGAGTQAFLIGIGRFSPDGASFAVDQYFMDDFAAEPLLIEAVDRELRDAGGLVTYNGRTYDMPLLASRWTMHRRPARFPEAHLDLLHPARRLWRLALESCSLGSIERNVLGIHRMNDVPGSLIPGIYLDSQRGLQPERLTGVFDHHAQDIYSMGALAALFALALTEPGHAHFAAAEVQWGLARMAESRGDRTAALIRLECAVLAARQPDLEWRLAMHLAKSYKRAGRIEDALSIWQARARECRRGRLEPLIELSKHAEHKLKDLQAAQRWTEQAINLLRQVDANEWYFGRSLNDSAAGDAEHSALAHRLARQQRKLGLGLAQETKR